MGTFLVPIFYVSSKNPEERINIMDLRKFIGDGGHCTIPEGITSIDGHAFSECKNLKSITIHKGITEIEGYAFYNCINLTSIEIPKSVRTIGMYAFAGCTNLQNITIEDGRVPNAMYRDPYGLKAIREYAFSDCKSLTSVTIPDSVEIIGECAFLGCWNMKNVKMPKWLIHIEPRTFAYTSIETVEIPKSVTSIGNGAFDSIVELRHLIIPENVIYIGDAAFGCCYNLEQVDIKSRSYCYVSNRAFMCNKNLRKVVITNKYLANTIEFDKGVYPRIIFA